jgi:hypothetical protein
MDVQVGFSTSPANPYSGGNVFQIPKIGSDGLNCTIR